MNINIYKGRVTKDPKISKVKDGTTILMFAIAVDRKKRDKHTGKKITDFINCVAWNSTAEFIANNFKCGQHILVRGEMHSHVSQKEKGGYYMAELQVESAEIVGARSCAV